MAKRKLSFRETLVTLDRCDFPVADFLGRRNVVMNGCIACRRFPIFAGLTAIHYPIVIAVSWKMLHKSSTSANTDRILNWKTSAHDKQQDVSPRRQKATWEKDWFMLFMSINKYRAYRVLVNEMTRYVKYLSIHYNNHL